MLFIKGYYFVFLVFIHAIVGVCALINRLKYPRRNLAVALRQLDARSEKDRLAAWRNRTIPACIK